MSINVNGITGVDGFAKPGDHVDLLLVENSEGTASANVLLQNVLLLSINQSMSAEVSDGDNSAAAAISNPSIATLALQPAEALQLISASKLGEIYMMLRPFNPREMYVDDLKYTAMSVAAQKKREQAEKEKSTPPPTQEPQVVPSFPPPVVAETVKTPELPVTVEEETPPAPPPVPKIEIIQGDQIVQKPDDDEKGGGSKK